SQLLTGDQVDNIKGCPRVGPVEAYKVLGALTTEDEMRDAVANLYFLKCGDKWREAMTENARLLWLIQDPEWVTIKDTEGVLKFTIEKLWELPDGYDIAKYDT